MHPSSSTSSSPPSPTNNRNPQFTQNNRSPIDRADARVAAPHLFSNNSNHFQNGVCTTHPESSSTAHALNTQQNILLSSNTVPYQLPRPVVEPELEKLYELPDIPIDPLPANQWNAYPNYTVTWGDNGCNFTQHVTNKIQQQNHSLDRMWEVIVHFAQSEPGLFVTHAGPIAYAIEAAAAAQGHKAENVNKLSQRILKFASAMERHHTNYDTIIYCYGINLKQLDKPFIENINFISESNPDYVHAIGFNLVAELNELFANNISFGEVKEKIEEILNFLPLDADKKNLASILYIKFYNHYLYGSLQDWLYDKKS